MPKRKVEFHMSLEQSAPDSAVWVPAPNNVTAARFRVLIGTTAVAYTIPDAWKGRRVRFKAQGGTVSVLFGTTSGVTVDRTAVVTGTPPAWTTTAGIGDDVITGTSEDWYIDPEWTHFSIQADTASTKFAGIPSDYYAKTGQV